MFGEFAYDDFLTKRTSLRDSVFYRVWIHLPRPDIAILKAYYNVSAVYTKFLVSKERTLLHFQFVQRLEMNEYTGPGPNIALGLLNSWKIAQHNPYCYANSTISLSKH